MTHILYPRDFSKNSSAYGGKAGALAKLDTANLPIPDWFVISPEAFNTSLTEKQKQKLVQATTVQAIQKIFLNLQVSDEIKQGLNKALANLCPDGEYVAVRSSALDEDGAQHSFAGQLDSFLFVAAKDVAKKVAAVWCSGFGERVLIYRQEAGLTLLPTAPAVLVQRMVSADVSGVAFGADPVSGRRSVALVSAVYGLGTALVSGESDADTFHVDKDGKILERSIAEKNFAHRIDKDTDEGVSSMAVEPELANQPVLNDEQILKVASLVRQTSLYFGRPQDIEWAIEKGELYLLQSRPITSLTDIADPDAALGIWDNSNIVESYGGITTPLTFSFALYAYEGVYRELCRILGFSKEKLKVHDNTFKHMLGLIKGRVYYNLLSWYKILAALPGFQANRAFMEQMMGVKESLPDDVIGHLAPLTWQGRWRDRAELGVSVIKLIGSHFALPRNIKKFYKRLNDALNTPNVPLTEMRPDELVNHYHDLEQKLLTSWDAPLVNDFLAMIFYGVLRKLCASWCDDAEGSLQNDLVSGEGGMISAEPAELVRELAALASKQENFPQLLSEGSLPEILKAIDKLTEFKKRYQDYLAKFGDRCLEELKLESSTLHDDPLLLLRSVGRLAAHFETDKSPTESTQHSLRQQAETKVKTTIKNPLRRLIFNWVLGQARARVRGRENLRFERTRLFGRVRSIFLELGKRFYALNLLEEPRDVFYLELNEALGFVEGVNTSTVLKDLVALRKAEFELYRQEDAPADRFETRGAVYQGNAFTSKEANEDLPAGDTLKGLGCCPGVVRGRVRIVTDPRKATLEVGDILVAERTDPGWIMLFPSASGLLVERGSLLSHSAIVAREMSIPAIVSLRGVTRWLKDGDEVEFDGSSGVVRKLKSTSSDSERELSHVE